MTTKEFAKKWAISENKVKKMLDFCRTLHIANIAKRLKYRIMQGRYTFLIKENTTKWKI